MSQQLFFATCLLGGLLISPSTVRASNSTKSFVMTASEPLIAGNKVLNPGTYVWKLLDSSIDRHIVQISDQKTGHVETTVIAIPEYRDQPYSENVMQFWETPVGVPRAVRSWFTPGDTYGQEFAYPKQLVAMLKSSLPEHKTNFATSPNRIPLSQKAPKRDAELLASVHTPALQQPAASAGSWAVVTGGASGPRKAASSTPRPSLWDKLKKLPLTATLAPLIGLIGIVSLTLWMLSYVKRKNIHTSPQAMGKG